MTDTFFASHGTDRFSPVSAMEQGLDSPSESQARIARLDAGSASRRCLSATGSLALLLLASVMLLFSAGQAAQASTAGHLPAAALLIHGATQISSADNLACAPGAKSRDEQCRAHATLPESPDAQHHIITGNDATVRQPLPSRTEVAQQRDLLGGLTGIVTGDLLLLLLGITGLLLGRAAVKKL